MNASAVNINQVLNQIRVRSQYLSQATEKPEPKTDFSTLLKQSLDEVDALQDKSGELRTAYEKGDPNIDLPEVMIAGQKASLSFEAVVEVRNRVLNAYQEIMNMQV